MARLYTRVYEFRPLSEEVKALRLGALTRSTGICVCVLQGVRTPVPEEGVAYIECTRTPVVRRYRVERTLRQGVTGNANYKELLMIFMTME